MATAPLPTPVERLRGLTTGGVHPPDDQLVAVGCRYLDAFEAVRGGLPGYLDRVASGAVADMTHERRLRAFCDHYSSIVGEPLDVEAQLALVGGYIDALDDFDAAADDFVAWLFAALEMARPAPAPAAAAAATTDAAAHANGAARPRRGKKKAAGAAPAGTMPGQQDLPLTDAEAPPAAVPAEVTGNPVVAEAAPKKAKKAKKADGPASLEGKKVKFRDGGAWAVGRVAADSGGDSVTFVPEDGGEAREVRRAFCKVIAARARPAAGALAAADDEAAAAPAPPPADIVITVPGKAARKYAALLAAGEQAGSKEAGAIIASYGAREGDYAVAAEVTNGTPGVSASYLDIYVSHRDPDGVRRLSFEHPPVATFTGRYTVQLGDVSRTLVIAAAP